MKSTRMKKTSQEELEVLYEEFEEHRAPSRQHSAYPHDEYSVPYMPPHTARPETRTGRPGTRLSTAFGISKGFRPQTSGRNMTPRCGTARPITGTVVGESSNGLNRPLTAIRGAGYSGPSKSKYHFFDPLNMGRAISGTVGIEPEDNPLNRLRKLELRIWELVDESIIANHDKKWKKALELGKDAELKEKVLQKQEEEEGYFQSHNWDLTFSVIFNLALQYEDNNMYADAMAYYSKLSCNDNYNVHGPKVKLNIGNIFVKQRKFEKAIKIYRMALDQLGSNEKNRLRTKLMQNMGLVLLEIGEYVDAATNFEAIMVEGPGFEAAFHLIVAHFMLNDAYATKTSFRELLQVPLPGEDETCFELRDDPDSHIMLDLISHDSLTKYAQEKKEFAEKCVLTAARLIAPLVEGTLAEGYDWVISTIKGSQHAAFSEALEISKGVHLIKQGEVGPAIAIFQEFERKETKFHSAAANNLAFIYNLQGDYPLALKHAELAVASDCYNEKSFVNLGNSLAALGDLDRARTLYFEAYRLDSSAVEVMYNLGLVDQRLGHYENALMSFKKTLHLLPVYGDVLYQIALTYELMQKPENAVEYYLKTLAVGPQDPGVFKKLGINADRLGDKQQAYCYYSDAFKCNRADIFVIKWLAMYMIEADLQDQAMDYFENGLFLEPGDPTWLLSMASCQKQLGNTGAAIHYYKETLQAFPDQVQALEGLMTLAKCLDRHEADWYRKKWERITGGFPNRNPWGLTLTTSSQPQGTGLECPNTPRCPKVDSSDSNYLWDFSIAGKGGRGSKKTEQQ